MSYWWVNAGMTCSVMCIGVGYYYRKNIGKHRVWMMAGVGFNVLAVLVLVVSIHGFYGGDMELAGFRPKFPSALPMHRTLSSVAALMMLLQVWTGISRRRSLHVVLHRIFLPLYLASYVSGLFIFTNAN